MSLVEKLQQTLSAFKECEIIQKQALREILEAVAENVKPESRAIEYGELAEVGKLVQHHVEEAFEIYERELRASAKELEGK
jgi:NADPH-dependent 7-cyano-7-deazaguanine reductase QueF